MADQKQFDDAAAAVKNLNTKPDNDTLLQLYSLFKQATTGDVQGSQPWAVQLEARAKWDAWNSRKGISQADARTQYVELANKLIAADK
jgi:diazepam-binding inhibitor (GABA receptor modulating acyl-CoA-binding protein)